MSWSRRKSGSISFDFGVAKILEHVPGLTGHGPTNTAMPAMTARYASPEQLQQRRSGRSSDIYSLGIILYELIAERHPFAEAYLHGVQQLIEATARPPAAPSAWAPDSGRLPAVVRSSLDHLAVNALAHDPQARYKSAGQFLADLRRCLEGAPVSCRAYSGA